MCYRGYISLLCLHLYCLYPRYHASRRKGRHIGSKAVKTGIRLRRTDGKVFWLVTKHTYLPQQSKPTKVKSGTSETFTLRNRLMITKATCFHCLEP